MNSKLRHDVAEVLSTAWPLMLSTGLFSITLFVDRLLLYKYSASSAAAAMGAGTFLWGLNCLPVGICGYTNTFVAQYLAARRPMRALQVVWQGVLLGLIFGGLISLLVFYAHDIFTWTGHSTNLVKQEATYFVWLMPGEWAMIVSAALVGLLAGSGRTLVLLYTDIVVSIVNALLAYSLIFGEFGFPELGVAGAAMASSIALNLKLLLLIGIIFKDFRPSQPWFASHQSHLPAPTTNALGEIFHWDWPLMRRLLRFGWPAGVSVVAEAWCFMIIMMIVGRIGETEADATTLALGVNVIAFIPLVGLGTATGVLVAKYLVQEQVHVAQRMVISGLMIGISYSLFFVVLYGGFPDWVITIYQTDTDPERFELMRPMLRPLLYFIAGYCMFDAFQTVFVGALKGAGDTHFVLLGHALAGSCTIAGGLLISHLTGWGGLYYWWSVMTAWVIILASIFTARYLHGGWKTKRVIEPAVTD